MDRLAGKLVERLREEPDEPAVVGLDGEEADQLFDALGSETSRAVLSACYEEGRTRSELAEVVETSVQNVGYHVDKLESAGLLEPVETRYGKNGREIRVYEPSKRAVVIATGEPGTVERLSNALERLFAPISLVGLVSLAAAVVARGPERVGMLGDDAVRTAAQSGRATGIAPFAAVFLVGLFVVLLADRRGAFESATDDRRTGRSALLLGRRPESTRRYVYWSVGLALATFLAVDLAVTGPTAGVARLFGLGAALAIPVGAVAATAHARSNDGVLVSWLAASAPVVGLWGYLAAAEVVRWGVDPAVAAAGVVVLAGIGFPLGSIGYLFGRLVRRRTGEASGPSRRVTALLAGYPIAVVCLAAGWLLSVI